MRVLIPFVRIPVRETFVGMRKLHRRRVPGILPCLAAVLLGACASSESDTMHRQTVPDAAYREALQTTDPGGFDLPAPGSAAEERMLDRVKDLFSDYSRQNLEKNVTEVYAEEVYFRDAFKQLSSAREIRAYFLEGLEALEDAEFVFNNVARSGGDFYFDWTMRLDFRKTASGTWEESMGVSRMRFNGEGKVIFHQDYWDPTDIVYERIPVAKQLIRFVKNRM